MTRHEYRTNARQFLAAGGKSEVQMTYIGCSSKQVSIIFANSPLCMIYCR